MTIFKIRRKSDGKFSTGGSSPGFNGIGKSWRQGPLKNHLNLVRGIGASWAYRDCEIVAYEMTEVSSKPLEM